MTRRIMAKKKMCVIIKAIKLAETCSNNRKRISSSKREVSREQLYFLPPGTRIAKPTEGDYLSDEGSVSRISADQNVQSSTSRLMLVTPLFHGHTIHHCVGVHDFDDSALFAQTRADTLARPDINPVTWRLRIRVDCEPGSNVTFTVLAKRKRGNMRSQFGQ